VAGQPQENPWSQQGQGYPQGAPAGYGPAYDQQGQPAPYPQQYEQQQYEPPAPPAGYEPPQTAVYEQQPEYGYPGQPQHHPGPAQPQPGPPQPGQPQPGQPRSQEQQDWRQWEAAQQQARAQNQRQGRNQGRKPQQKSSSGQQGFVSSLFDFGFNSFVTPKIIKALYAIVAAWTILWAIVLLFIGMHQWGITGLLLMLIIVDPLLILLSLGLLRVALEFFMITFRMQEDLRALREQAGAARGDADTVVGRVSGPDA